MPNDVNIRHSVAKMLKNSPVILDAAAAKKQTVAKMHPINPGGFM